MKTRPTVHLWDRSIPRDRRGIILRTSGVVMSKRKLVFVGNSVVQLKRKLVLIEFLI